MSGRWYNTIKIQRSADFKQLYTDAKGTKPRGSYTGYSALFVFMRKAHLYNAGNRLYLDNRDFNMRFFETIFILKERICCVSNYNGACSFRIEIPWKQGEIKRILIINIFLILFYCKYTYCMIIYKHSKCNAISPKTLNTCSNLLINCWHHSLKRSTTHHLLAVLTRGSLRWGLVTKPSWLP